MTNKEFFDIGRVAYITGNVQEALVAKQALEKVVENANSLQQLKAEITADMKNVLFNHQDYSHTELVAIIEGWQRQLSAV